MSALSSMRARAQGILREAGTDNWQGIVVFVFVWLVVMAIVALILAVGSLVSSVR